MSGLRSAYLYTNLFVFFMNDFAQLTALSKHSGDLTQRPPLKITAGTQKQMEAKDVAFFLKKGKKKQDIIVYKSKR